MVGSGRDHYGTPKAWILIREHQTILIVFLKSIVFPRHPVDGQRWAQHQWFPVLCLHGQDPVAGWQARRLRTGRRGHGGRQEGEMGLFLAVNIPSPYTPLHPSTSRRPPLVPVASPFPLPHPVAFPPPVLFPLHHPVAFPPPPSRLNSLLSRLITP